MSGLEGRFAFVLTEPAPHAFIDESLEAGQNFGLWCPRRNPNRVPAEVKTGIRFIVPVHGNTFLLVGINKMELNEVEVRGGRVSVVRHSSYSCRPEIGAVLVEKKDCLTFAVSPGEIWRMQFSKKEKVFSRTTVFKNPGYSECQFLDSTLMLAVLRLERIDLVETKGLRVTKSVLLRSGVDRLRLLTNADGWCLALYTRGQRALCAMLKVAEAELKLEEEEEVCSDSQADMLMQKDAVLTLYNKTTFFANYRDEVVMFKQFFGKFKPVDSLMLRNRKGSLSLLPGGFILVSNENDAQYFKLHSAPGNKFDVCSFDYLLCDEKIRHVVVLDTTVLFVSSNSKSTLKGAEQLNLRCTRQVSLEEKLSLLDPSTGLGDIDLVAGRLGISKKDILGVLWAHSAQTYENLVRIILRAEDYAYIRLTLKNFLRSKNLPVRHLLAVEQEIHPARKEYSSPREIKLFLKSDLLICKYALEAEVQPGAEYDFRQYQRLSQACLLDQVLEALSAHNIYIAEQFLKAYRLVLLENYRRLMAKAAQSPRLLQLLRQQAPFLPGRASVLWQPPLREEYDQSPNEEQLMNPNFVEVTRQFMKDEWFKWHALTKHRYLTRRFKDLCQWHAEGLSKAFYCFIALVYEHNDAATAASAVSLLEQNYVLPPHLCKKVTFYREYYLMLRQTCSLACEFQLFLSLREHEVVKLYLVEGNRCLLLFGEVRQFYEQSRQSSYAKMLQCFFEEFQGQTKVLLFLLKEVNLTDREFVLRNQEVLHSLVQGIASQVQAKDSRGLDLTLNYLGNLELEEATMRLVEEIYQSREFCLFFEMFRVELSLAQVRRAGIALIESLTRTYLTAVNLYHEIAVGEEVCDLEKPASFLEVLLMLGEIHFPWVSEQEIVLRVAKIMLEYDQVEVVDYLIREDRLLEDHNVPPAAFEGVVDSIVSDVFAHPNKQNDLSFAYVQRLFVFFRQKTLVRRTIKTKLKYYAELKAVEETVSLPPPSNIEYLSHVLSSKPAEKLALLSPLKLAKHIIKANLKELVPVDMGESRYRLVHVKVLKIFIFRLVTLGEWQKAHRMIAELLSHEFELVTPVFLALAIGDELPMEYRQKMRKVVMLFISEPRKLNDFCLRVAEELESERRKECINSMLCEFELTLHSHFFSDQAEHLVDLQRVERQLEANDLVSGNEFIFLIYWCTFADREIAKFLFLGLSMLLKIEAFEVAFLTLYKQPYINKELLNEFVLDLLLSLAREATGEEDEEAICRKLEATQNVKFSSKIRTFIGFKEAFRAKPCPDEPEERRSSHSKIEEYFKEIHITSNRRGPGSFNLRSNEHESQSSKDIFKNTRVNARRITCVRPSAQKMFRSVTDDFARSQRLNRFERSSFSQFQTPDDPAAKPLSPSQSDFCRESPQPLAVDDVLQSVEERNKLSQYVFMPSGDQYGNFLTMPQNEGDNESAESSCKSSRSIDRNLEEESSSIKGKYDIYGILEDIRREKQAEEEREKERRQGGVQQQQKEDGSRKSGVRLKYFIELEEVKEEESIIKDGTPTGKREVCDWGEVLNQQEKDQAQYKIQVHFEGSQKGLKQDCLYSEQAAQGQFWTTDLEVEPNSSAGQAPPNIQSDSKGANQQPEPCLQQVAGAESRVAEQVEQQQQGQQVAVVDKEESRVVQVGLEQQREQVPVVVEQEAPTDAAEEAPPVFLLHQRRDFIQGVIEQGTEFMIQGLNSETALLKLSPEERTGLLVKLLGAAFEAADLKCYLRLVEEARAREKELAKLIDNRLLKILQTVGKAQGEDYTKRIFGEGFLFSRIKATTAEKYFREVFKLVKPRVKQVIDETNIFAVSKLISMALGMEKLIEYRVQFYFVERLLSEVDSLPPEEARRSQEKVDALLKKHSLDFLLRKLRKRKQRGEDLALERYRVLRERLVQKSETANQFRKEVAELLGE